LAVEMLPGTSLVLVASTYSREDLTGDYTIEVSTRLPPEVGELCDDGEDNDGDEAADCADSGCFSERVCMLSEVEAAPAGQAVYYSGDLADDDLLWARPAANCSDGGRDPTYYFEASTVTNATDAEINVRVTAVWPGDGFLHVFGVPFDPNNLDNCLGGDDDFETLRGSRVASVTIPAGGAVTVVASTYGEGVAFGPFGIEVYTLEP
jgi:hypothetical protein